MNSVRIGRSWEPLDSVADRIAALVGPGNLFSTVG